KGPPLLMSSVQRAFSSSRSFTRTRTRVGATKRGCRRTRLPGVEVSMRTGGGWSDSFSGEGSDDVLTYAAIALAPGPVSTVRCGAVMPGCVGARDVVPG